MFPCPVDNDPYYLAGLIESCLRVYWRKSKNRPHGVFYPSSYFALYVIQRAFGGVATKNCKKIRPHLVFNFRQLTNIGKILLPLSTPFQELYTLFIKCSDLKSTFDGYRNIKDANYRAEYRQQIEEIEIQIKTFRSVQNFSELPITYQDGRARGIEEATDDDSQYQSFLVRSKTKEQQEKEIAEQSTAIREAKAIRHAERMKEIAKKRRDEADQRKAVRLESKRQQKEEATRLRQLRLEKRATERLERQRREEEQRATLLRDIAQGFKVCTRCDRRLPTECFNKNYRLIGGFTHACKQCIHERYVIPNRVRGLERAKKWQADNPDKFRASQKKQKLRPSVRLHAAIKKRIREYLEDSHIKMRRSDYIGCTGAEFRKYLEDQFLLGMNWGNYGGKNGWHLDHIVPVTAFQCENYQHVKWCWNYRNLRPLWGEDNMNKSDQIGGVSVRQLRASSRLSQLHELVGNELERLGIAKKNEYMESISEKVNGEMAPGIF